MRKNGKENKRSNMDNKDNKDNKHNEGSKHNKGNTHNKASKKTRTDDNVGYCNPPKKHRWKKGQSGNPRGRPKKAHLKPILYGLDPITARLVERAAKKLMVRTPDGDAEMTLYEAIFEATAKAALRGNVKAADSYLNRIIEAMEKSQQPKAELQRFVVEHQAAYSVEFETAERLGAKLPSVLPHPKDISIEENGDISVLGPVTPSDQQRMEEHLKARDEADDALRFYYLDPERYDNIPAEIVEIVKARREMFNAALPPRLQTPIEQYLDNDEQAGDAGPSLHLD